MVSTLAPRTRLSMDSSVDTPAAVILSKASSGERSNSEPISFMSATSVSSLSSLATDCGAARAARPTGIVGAAAGVAD